MGHKICVGDGCIGIGVCEDIAPDVFMVGEGGRAQPRTPAVDDARMDSVREAAAACPTESIEILES
ncbi:ferredoxin [Nocardia gamkensis]|uniref:ferredoxin n=1 Tax=Nocardia gamkensis TaxID=352869 RepID=UPI0037CA7B36